MELIDIEMPTWGPGSRHYVTNGGMHVVVHAHSEPSEEVKAHVAKVLGLVGGRLDAVVPEPTTIMECTPEGYAISLTPLATFPAGTSHEDALAHYEEG